jgi:CBS domain-containing protein
MKVRDVMTTELVTCTPDEPLKAAARALVEHRISGAPVVDADRRVVGIVSEADIVAKELDGTRSTSALSRLLEGFPPDDRFHAVTVGEAMSSPAITLGADEPVTRVAATMLAEGINRIPVVDDDGRLVGLVSRADLVRAFARDDATVKAELEQMIRDDLWIDPKTIAIEVVNGRVTLEGEVEADADLRLVQTFARRVPGVVEVSSLLRVR